MVANEDKKVLVLIGTDSKVEKSVQDSIHVDPQNMFTLQIDEAEIFHPFGDLMRTIIVSVYRDNIDEIVVIGTNGDPRKRENKQNLFEQMNKDGRLEKKMKVLDYLFTNCRAEFSDTNLREWLEGGNIGIEGIEKNIRLIRRHPLMPSDVKVYGLFIDEKSGKPSEVAAS